MERGEEGKKSAKNLNLKVRWRRDSPPYKSLWDFTALFPTPPYAHFRVVVGISFTRSYFSWKNFLLSLPEVQKRERARSMDKNAPMKSHYRDNEIG